MTDHDSTVTCERCGAAYRPKLTRWTCPVCDAPPPSGSVALPSPRLWDDPENRVLAMVIGSTVANVLLLALLAVLVLRLS